MTSCTLKSMCKSEKPGIGRRS